MEKKILVELNFALKQEKDKRYAIEGEGIVDCLKKAKFDFVQVGIARDNYNKYFNGCSPCKCCWGAGITCEKCENDYERALAYCAFLFSSNIDVESLSDTDLIVIYPTKKKTYSLVKHFPSYLYDVTESFILRDYNILPEGKKEIDDTYILSLIFGNKIQERAFLGFFEYFDVGKIGLKEACGF